AILSLPRRLIMVDALAGADLAEDLVFFIVKPSRDQAKNRLADHLVGGIAEDLARAFIPAGDDALEIFADDGIVRRVDYGGEMDSRVEGRRVVRRRGVHGHRCWFIIIAEAAQRVRKK